MSARLRLGGVCRAVWLQAGALSLVVCGMSRTGGVRGGLRHPEVIIKRVERGGARLLLLPLFSTVTVLRGHRVVFEGGMCGCVMRYSGIDGSLCARLLLYRKTAGGGGCGTMLRVFLWGGGNNRVVTR